MAGGRLADRRAGRAVTNHVRYIAAAEGLPVLDGRLTVKLGADDTAGAYSFLRGHTPPGLGPPLHVHELEDETFYVVRGTYEMQCGEELVTVGPGSCLHLPRYTPHTFRNVSDEQGELVELMTPGGLDRYFDAVSHLGPSADDLVTRTDIGRPFGISFLDDPGAYIGPPLGKIRRPITVTSRGEGNRVDLGGQEAACLLDRAEAGGTHSLYEVELTPNEALRLTPHPGRSLVFVIDGRVAVESGADAFEAGTEDAIGIPPRIDVEIVNTDGRPARFLVVSIEAAT